jgi:hypothetical protein
MPANCYRTSGITRSPNHALGITNLLRLTDPVMVVIGWASAALPENLLTRTRTLAKMPGPDGDSRSAGVPGMARRGAPSIVYATHLKDTCTLGAAALILARVRRPPDSEGQAPGALTRHRRACVPLQEEPGTRRAGPETFRGEKGERL